MFRNDNRRYAPDADTWNIQKPQWQRIFRIVAGSPGVTMKGTENDFTEIISIFNKKASRWRLFC